MKYQGGRVWILVFLLGVPLTVFAQATNPVDQTALIQALLARIDQLEKRVVELENRPRETTQAPAIEPVAPAEGRAAPPMESVHREPRRQLERAELQPTYPSLGIVGF